MNCRSGAGGAAETEDDEDFQRWLWRKDRSLRGKQGKFYILCVCPPKPGIPSLGVAGLGLVCSGVNTVAEAPSISPDGRRVDVDTPKR